VLELGDTTKKLNHW